MDGEKLKGFLKEQRKKIADSELPLRNIRVLDIGSIVAAPYAATILSDFGAEVIKVEPHVEWHDLRYFCLQSPLIQRGFKWESLPSWHSYYQC